MAIKKIKSLPLAVRSLSLFKHHTFGAQTGLKKCNIPFYKSAYNVSL